jgi:hypothetical protein
MEQMLHASGSSSQEQALWFRKLRQGHWQRRTARGRLLHAAQRLRCSTELLQQSWAA